MNSFTGSTLRLAAGLPPCAVSAVAGTTPSSISLAARPNPVLYGQLVTLTAAVSSASATGYLAVSIRLATGTAGLPAS